MESKISLFMAVVLIAFTTSQCKKKKADEEPAQETPTPGTSLTTIAEVFTIAGTPTQNYTVNTSVATILDVNGVKVEIPANSFVTSSSGTVGGIVDVNVRTILTKSQIILSGAGGGTTGSRLVTTKGCVKVTASQNTQSLRLSPTTTVIVKVPDGPSFPSPMKKYYAKKISASDSTLIWAMGDDLTNIPASMDTATATYHHNASLDSLKWLNVGAVWDTIGGPAKKAETVTVNGTMFNKNNCAIYISFNNHTTIGALTEISSGTFRIANIPPSKGVHFYGIAIISGQYYFGFVSTLTGAVSNALNLQPTTLSQIQAELATLP